MASNLKRKEDSLHAHQQQPGLTAAKRPKLMSLVQDGTIDLKRYLDPEVAQKYQVGTRIKNNRERKLGSLPILMELMYDPKRPPELRKYTGVHVEIRITRDKLPEAAVFIKKRSIWGDKHYTADTDLFSALVHQGYLPARCTEAAFVWPEPILEIRAIVKVTNSQDWYPSSNRNGVKTRAWASACFNCSFCIERAWIMSAKDDNLVEIELDAVPEGERVEVARPYFVLSQWDVRMSTRQITHASDRRRRNHSEVATIQYNLVNEPWLMYTSTGIADRGFGIAGFTAMRFSKEVLYMESERERYELSLVPAKNGLVNGGSGGAAKAGSTFMLCRCNRILPEDMMALKGTPMPSSMKTVLHTNLPWENLLWGEDSLEVMPLDDGKPVLYGLARMHWMPMHAAQTPGTGESTGAHM